MARAGARARTMQRPEARQVSKSHRHRILRKLLEDGVPRSQKDIVERLSAAGVETTQATVSRDLDELGASRIRTESGRHAYALGGGNRSLAAPRSNLGKRLGESAISVESSGDMIVIRTLPGHAQFVAAAIDDSKLPDIIGTIAGDDTILVVAAARAGQRVLRKIRAVAGIGGESEI